MAKNVILYVDDDQEVLMSFKIGLEDRGYTMLTAQSGDEALEMLKINTPDLIIADLRMQPMNGFDLYQNVRKNPSFAQIPFFFLTAVDDFLAQKYGQKLGVDAYITKPVDLDNLDAIISSKLSEK
jgi:DNA-binding response OmpR family regulator